MKTILSRPLGRLFYWPLLIALAGLAVGTGWAQTQKTQLDDHLYRADGTAAAGTLLISWPGFTTANGDAVAAGSMSLKIGTGGAVSVSLVPNTGSTPASSYKVTVRSNDGVTSEEYWTVPATATATIAGIRSKLAPAAVAQQFVGRDYVDTALAGVSSSGLKSTESYADPQWLTTLSASKLTGALPSGALPANAAKKDTANTWTATQTFASGLTGTGDTGGLTLGPGATGAGNSWSGTQSFADYIAKGPVMDARYYGLSGDGATDNTANFNTMIAAACALNARTIQFPAGQFRFTSKPNAIGCGLVLRGQGNGSTCQFGTCLISDYNESTSVNGFITFDGAYATAGGTGGGIENLFLEKGAAKAGGVALKLTGADDNHRAGHFHASHVQVGSTMGGTWNYGVYIDGSLLTNPGGQGIRDIDLFGVYANGATTHTVYVDNVAKLHWYGGEVYQGAGSIADVVITGEGGAGVSPRNSTEVMLELTISGSLTIDQASNVQAYGHIASNLNVSSNTSFGQFHGVVTGTITNSSTSFSVQQSSRDTAAYVTDRICAGFSYTCGGSQGDSTNARSATTGFVWLGSDYNAYFGRVSDSVFTLGGGHAQVLQIAGGTNSALELNTNTFLRYTGAGAVSLGSTNGGTDGALTLATVTATTVSGGTVTASSGIKAGASGSTISDTRELVQSVHSCGTTTACANTANGSNRMLLGKVTLSSGTATVTGMPAWSSTASYICTGTDATATAAVKIVNTSTTSITITGTSNDVIGYHCIGN